MTVIISLYYKETNQNVVFTLPLQVIKNTVPNKSRNTEKLKK